MTWPQDAYIGQKVVCINNKNLVYPGGKPLILNQIYTIGEIDPNCGGVVGFLILELHEEGDRLYWWRFRPVQSTETGMEILRKLQNPANHKNLDKVKADEPVAV